VSWNTTRTIRVIFGTNRHLHRPIHHQRSDNDNKVHLCSCACIIHWDMCKRREINSDSHRRPVSLQSCVGDQPSAKHGMPGSAANNDNIHLTQQPHFFSSCYHVQRRINWCHLLTYLTHQCRYQYDSAAVTYWKANSDDPRSLLVRNALSFVLATYWYSVFIQDNCWKKNKQHQYSFFKSLNRINCSK